MWKSQRFSLFAITITAMLLCGAGYDRLSTPGSADAAPYLAKVREEADRLPLRVGNWVGKEIPLPQAAVTLLRPNVLLSREYLDLMNGRRASFLLVQCADARDMQGHYPPVCYPNSGWRETRRVARDWQVNGRVVRGVEYEFEGQPLSGRSSIIIYNTMLLPGEAFVPDMESVRARAAQSAARLWGAGQVQVIFEGTTPASERDDAFASLLSAHEPLMSAVLGDSAPTGGK